MGIVLRPGESPTASGGNTGLGGPWENAIWTCAHLPFARVGSSATHLIVERGWDGWGPHLHVAGSVAHGPKPACGIFWGL